MSTYGGNAVLGAAVRILMDPLPNDAQETAYFGTTGVYSLDGGGRGRTFAVAGLFYGPTSGAAAAMRNNLLSYADGIGRVLYDSAEGTAWAQVRFTGVCRWTGDYGYDTQLGWSRPYEALFRGNL